MKNLFSNFIKGLFKNSQKENQPEGTYNFALNAVNNTDKKEFNALSNEKGNEPCHKLPEGYIPIGKVYVGDGEMAIFSTLVDGSMSEIGIAKEGCKYETHVNFKLDFKITNQIDATFRLRNGCEKIVYWVDGKNNPPMFYNFSRPKEFKTGGIFDKNKFSLQTTFSKFPKFTNVEVLEGQGLLPPGSINIGIQYVDSNNNATNVITTTPIINIYKDDTSADYNTIDGSVNAPGDPLLDFGLTSKAIKVETDLDTSFQYYRLVFMEATNNNGSVTAVKFTDLIPTTTNVFVYTGENYLEEGAIEDVKFGFNHIGFADSIEQINNRLVLANIGSSVNNYCALQKVASKIQVDLFVGQTSGDSITYGNTKNPTYNFEMSGFMPGEIYSLGVVFIFEDNSISPAYHIPGKNHSTADQTFFDSTNTNDMVFPMSIDNENINQTYNSMKYDCSSGDYWGKDSSGDSLLGTPIRHHRFPYRNEINTSQGGVPMVKKTLLGNNQQIVKFAKITATGTIDTPCTQQQKDNNECPTVQDPPIIQVRVTLNVNGTNTYFVFNIDPDYYSSSPGSAVITAVNSSNEYYTNNFSVVKIEELKDDGVTWIDVTNTTSPHGLDYSSSIESDVKDDKKYGYDIFPFGLKFSNIDIAYANSISDKKIIGYKIVRNERLETDKTILDSGILTPSVNNKTEDRLPVGVYHKTVIKANENWGDPVSTKTQNKDFITSGLLRPVFEYDHFIIPPIDSLDPNNTVFTNLHDTSPPGDNYYWVDAPFGTHHWREANYRISDKYLSLIYPNSKFRNKEYNSVAKIKHTGYFTFNFTDAIDYDTFNLNKALDSGTSYDKDIHRKGHDDVFVDEDGSSFRGMVRSTDLDFKCKIDNNNSFNLDLTEIKSITKLDGLESKDYPGLQGKYINLSADNKVSVVELENSDPSIPNKMYTTIPYVYLEMSRQDNYIDFTHRPYYPIHNNMIDANISDPILFGGDTHISSMNYFSSLNVGEKLAFRPKKSNVWKAVLGIVIDVVAIVGAFFTGGATLGLLDLGTKMIMSGVTSTNMIKAYKNFAKEGLMEAVMDVDTFTYFRWSNPSDDEQQWFGDCLTNVWFESDVNISLRNRLKEVNTNFLKSPQDVNITHYIHQHGWDYQWYGFAPKKEIWRMNSNITENPNHDVGEYLKDKLLDYNSGTYYSYILPPFPEVYYLNKDYDRMNKEEVYFTLDYSYDCCSKCKGSFPYRVSYSQKSFQEGEQDNYRIFLPNNYKDIDSSTGHITDLFTIRENLYIHTENSLWHLPKSHQKVVTDQIVSYIGTGEFFSIPPINVTDDIQSSGGSMSKWSTLKIEGIVYFVSENDKTVYEFNGQKISPIVGGISKWFYNNIPILANNLFYKSGLVFPYLKNPYNPDGVGFISVHDKKNNRLIITKRDKFLVDEGYNTICKVKGEYMFVSDEYIRDLVKSYTDIGWYINSIKDCSVILFKEVEENHAIQKIVEIPKEGYTLVTDELYNNSSWTISYDLRFSAMTKGNVWVSWHSYLPNFYFSLKDKFYSFLKYLPNGAINNSTWRHGEGKYQTFYGKFNPFIVEYTSHDKDIQTKIWNFIRFFSKAKRYNLPTDNSYEERYITFNKAIFYNSRQSSGVLNLIIKDVNTPPEDYMVQQVQDFNSDTIILDRNERDWTLNEMRDFRIDYSVPMFNKKLTSLQSDYFIDKTVNISSINHNKDWDTLESFRDKYLTIRLIFDNFDDVNLIFNFSVENEDASHR